MRGIVIAVVLTIFGVACTPHTTPNTDASFDSGPSISDMGTTTNGLPDQGSSTDGGNPTYTNKATLEIAGAGTGSVALGSAKYSCPQFQPCQWAELNVTGSVLVATPDTGSEFSGWIGPCDPQVTAKNKAQCKVLASATTAIPKVTAVFSPVCSADGWCSTRLPIPAGRIVMSAETLGSHLNFLASDGWIYRIDQTPNTPPSSLLPFTANTYPLAMCSTGDGTLYTANNSGLVAAFSADGPNITTAKQLWLSLAAPVNEPITTLICNNNTVMGASIQGALYLLSTGMSPSWQKVVVADLLVAAGNLPSGTTVSFTGGYSIADGDALFVGASINAGNNKPLVVRLKNGNLTIIPVPMDVTMNLYGVHGIGERAWIVGAAGTVLYWDGASIKLVTLPSGASDPLLTVTSYLVPGMAGVTSDTLQAYVAGFNGKMYHCSGTSCVAETSGVRSPTLRASFTTPTMHVVCGSESTCLTKQR